MLHLFIFFMTNSGFFRIILVSSRCFAPCCSARNCSRTGGSRGTDIRSTTSATIATANSTRATSGTGTPETGAFCKREESKYMYSFPTYDAFFLFTKIENCFFFFLPCEINKKNKNYKTNASVIMTIIMSVYYTKFWKKNCWIYVLLWENIVQ